MSAVNNYRVITCTHRVPWGVASTPTVVLPCCSGVAVEFRKTGKFLVSGSAGFDALGSEVPPCEPLLLASVTSDREPPLVQDRPQVNAALDAVRCLYLARVAEREGHAEAARRWKELADTWLAKGREP